MTHRRSLGLLALTALAAVHCSSAAGSSSPSASGGGEGASSGASLGGHANWSPGANGSVAGNIMNVANNPSTTGGLSGPTSAASSSGASPGAGGSAGTGVPLDPCAFTPTGPTTLSFAIPRARATVSPAQARGVLQLPGSTQIPAPARVAAGEFLNYYRPIYDVVTTPQLEAGLQAGPLSAQHLLQLAVQAPTTPVRGSKTVLTAVVDTSTAMVGGGMDRARAALHALIASLAPGDTLNVATSNTDASPHTFAITGPTDPTALKLADALVIDGGDDLGGALVNGYLLANKSLAPGGLNRVVLITAGSAPQGTIDNGLVAAQAERGIVLVGVGVGPALAYDDALLGLATEASNGADVYLDSPEEADVILHQRFDEVMDVAASAVTVEVTIPSYLGFESVSGTGSQSSMSGPTTLASPDLGPGRPMIFRMTIAGCLPKGDTDTFKIVLNYTLPGGKPTQVVSMPTVASMLQESQTQIAKASAVVAYADALSGLDAARIVYAQKLAADPGFDADADFADPKNGIRALLTLEAAHSLGK